MKITSSLRFILGGSLAALFFTHSVHAADGTWTGGALANWDTSNTNWSGVGDPAWDAVNGPSNKAIFSASSTLTLVSSVYASSIEAAAGSSLGIAVTGANSYTINSPFAQASTTGNIINKTDSGTLILAGNSVLVGDINGNLNAGFTVDGGGELQLSGGLKAASSLQANKGNFTNTVGATSGDNTLRINGSSGATVYAGGIAIGANATGGNEVYISRPGDLTTPSYLMAGSGHKVELGISSSNNLFEVSNGAYVRQGQGGGTNLWTIGVAAGANTNEMRVTGTGSTIDRGGAAGSAIAVGGAGSSNSLSIESGGTVKPRRLEVGLTGGDNNAVTIDGTNSNLTISGDSNGWIKVGVISGANGNSITVQNAGLLTYANTGTNRQFSIGGVAGATNNFLTVTGSTSAVNITHTQPLTAGGTAVSSAFTDAGNTAVGNHIDVHSGGALTTNSSIYLGGGDTGVSTDPDYLGQTNLTAFNIGNGTGASTVTVGASSGYNAGVYLNSANTVVNFNSGKLIAGADGNLVSGAGKVDLLGDASVSTTFSGSVISTEITGSGDFTKEGTGTLDLTFANTYTGDTIVAASGGILKMENAYLANGAAVRLFSGGQLDLNTSGATDTIAALYFDGVLQAGGTWGGTGSGATNINTTFFAPNSGKLFVGVIPEPAAALLGGLGMLTLLRRRRLA